MASAGTDPTPTKRPRGREERECARKRAAEHLQQASAEIDKACQEATAAVRRSRDSALEWMRDVSAELRQRAEDQTAQWQDALEHTSDKARRQMGRRGIGVQCRIQSAASEPLAVLPKSVRPVGRVKARWPRSTSWP